MYAVERFVSSVTSCTALRATPTAPAVDVQDVSAASIQSGQMNPALSPLNKPIASRVQIAVPRFWEVPNATTVRPFPTRDAQRTARRPCFSAIETQSIAVANCDRKLQRVCAAGSVSCYVRGDAGKGFTHKTAETTPVQALTADSPPPFSPTPKLSTMLRTPRISLR